MYPNNGRVSFKSVSTLMFFLNKQTKKRRRKNERKNDYMQPFRKAFKSFNIVTVIKLILSVT